MQMYVLCWAISVPSCVIFQNSFSTNADALWRYSNAILWWNCGINSRWPDQHQRVGLNTVWSPGFFSNPTVNCFFSLVANLSTKNFVNSAPILFAFQIYFTGNAYLKTIRNIQNREEKKKKHNTRWSVRWPPCDASVATFPCHANSFSIRHSIQLCNAALCLGNWLRSLARTDGWEAADQILLTTIYVHLLVSQCAMCVRVLVVNGKSMVDCGVGRIVARTPITSIQADAHNRPSAGYRWWHKPFLVRSSSEQPKYPIDREHVSRGYLHSANIFVFITFRDFPATSDRVARSPTTLFRAIFCIERISTIAVFRHWLILIATKTDLLCIIMKNSLSSQNEIKNVCQHCNSAIYLMHRDVRYTKHTLLHNFLMPPLPHHVLHFGKSTQNRKWK